jgi:inner membrane protein
MRSRRNARQTGDNPEMASAVSHAVVALGLATCFYKPAIPKRVWVAGAICSMFPDVDVVGFHFGVQYGDVWGHRGFTHSLVFAALLGGAVVALFFRRGVTGLAPLPLFAYLFLATVSHGVLDAMTNGGLGVAFLSPFDNTRFFLPWRPIRVSPIVVGRFLSLRGYAVLKNELLWIWLPTGIFSVLVLLLRRPRTNANPHGAEVH